MAQYCQSWLAVAIACTCFSTRQLYAAELKATDIDEFSYICSGALPNVTGAFSQTQVFDVASNSLTGTIPAAFSSLGAVNKSLVSCYLLLLWLIPYLVNRKLDRCSHIRLVYLVSPRCVQHQSCVLFGIVAPDLSYSGCCSLTPKPD